MNMLKFALCSLLAISLTGCGGGDKKDKDAKPADSSKVTPDPAKDKDSAAKAAADLAASAKARFDEVTAALKEGNLKGAEDGVKALEGMKSKLSQEWQDKITAISAQLEAAKKAPVLPKLPDVPKVPALPK